MIFFPTAERLWYGKKHNHNCQFTAEQLRFFWIPSLKMWSSLSVVKHHKTLALLINQFEPHQS